MSAVIAVGLPGPAAPATGKSPPGHADTGQAAPFADVLHGAGPPDPATTSTEGDAPGPEPESLDVVALLQLLLGGDAVTGGQTATETGTQLDRPAEAGTNENETVADATNEELLLALLAQLALPATDAAAERPLVAPAAVSVAGQAAAASSAIQQQATEVVDPTSLDGAAAVTQEVNGEDGGKGPRVILPDAASDAPRSSRAPVQIAEGEQQHAVPLSGRNGDVAPVDTAAEGATDLAALEEAVNFEVDASDQANLEPIDVDADPDPLAADAVDGDPVVQRTPLNATNVEAPVNAAATQTAQPSTVTVQSPAPTAGPDSAPADVVASETFSAELASTVRRASLLGDQEVRLLLNPPELGHLDVRIVEAPDGLRVVLEAATAEAHELIERHLPSLRTALEARDLRVDRLSVQQSLDTPSADDRSTAGWPQGGQGQTGSGQSGEDAAPWSPVASLRSDGLGESAGNAGGAVASDSNARTAAGDGRLDVLA